uniref:F-box domain-containing protein n=1 Tax=Caenorhabditis tropicalis TaxID=1561998 RepID=A0A1I7UT53_9PELO
MSFPLLRLPCLALEEVLKNFNPKEILFLVQTSLRTRRRVSRLKPISIKVLIVDGMISSYAAILCKDEDTFRIKTYTRGVSFNSSWRFQTVVPVRYEENALVSRWTQKGIAFQEILDFLNEIFRIKDVSFDVKEDSSYLALHILERCVSQNLKIGSVDWPLFSGSNETVERIFMASKGAYHLNIQGYNSSPIRFNHFHLFRMNRLRIGNASWMTLENIVALRNCKRIRLGCAWDHVSDVNTILREFMKNPGELQELQMSCHYANKLEEMVEGLNIFRSEEENAMRNQKYWFTGRNGIRFSATMERMTEIVIKRET